MNESINQSGWKEGKNEGIMMQRQLTLVRLRSREDGAVLLLHLLYIGLDFVNVFPYLIHLVNEKRGLIIVFENSILLLLILLIMFCRA